MHDLDVWRAWQRLSEPEKAAWLIRWEPIFNDQPLTAEQRVTARPRVEAFLSEELAREGGGHTHG